MLMLRSLANDTSLHSSPTRNNNRNTNNDHNDNIINSIKDKSGHGHGPGLITTTTSNTTVAAHTKLRLLSKVHNNMRQQSSQNQSVDKLITTAATGTGVVGDVDGLLTPMRLKHNGYAQGHSLQPSLKELQQQQQQQQQQQHHHHHQQRPERNLWSRAEMLEMLSIMQQTNALELLNDRNVKSDNVFRHIEEIMHSKGYVKKSSVQIWTKWKFLKSTYNTTKRHGTVPKVVPGEVYKVLCRMLDSNGDAGGDEEGSDYNTSTNSMDGMSESKADASNEGDLGVEHPIFGFRLGLVKPEPADTGYETTVNQDNNSEHESTFDNSFDHTPFIVSVKHEEDMDAAMNGTNTPPPTAPASPSPSSRRRQTLEVELEPSETMLTSTPKPPLQMPPLRVASFAKDAQKGILQIERPPPPLTKPLNRNLSGHSPHGAGRPGALSSTSNISFNTKLMLPKLPPSQARKQMNMRLPRDISLQPANHVRSDMMRLKSVPMRPTPYSLRPERMIPDLEQSISPPQSPSPTLSHQQGPPVPTMLSRAQPQMLQHSEFGPSAMTSRQAQMEAQYMQQQQRKRRSLLDSVAPQPVPVKLQRSGPGPSMEAPLYNEAKPVFKSPLSAEEQRRKEDAAFEKELEQFASALRAAQKDMLQDFFRQQKELARQEHEFQLKQDTMVMRALRKQTAILMRKANELIQQPEPIEEPQPEQEFEPEPEPQSEQLEQVDKTDGEQNGEEETAELEDVEECSPVEPEIQLQMDESSDQIEQETETEPEQTVDQLQPDEDTQGSGSSVQSEAKDKDPIDEASSS